MLYKFNYLAINYFVNKICMQDSFARARTRPKGTWHMQPLGQARATIGYLVYKNKIISELQHRNIANGIFIDLSKAFDTLDHSKLIIKLEHNGCPNQRPILRARAPSFLSSRNASG